MFMWYYSLVAILLLVGSGSSAEVVIRAYNKDGSMCAPAAIRIIWSGVDQNDKPFMGQENPVTVWPVIARLPPVNVMSPAVRLTVIRLGTAFQQTILINGEFTQEYRLVIPSLP